VITRYYMRSSLVAWLQVVDKLMGIGPMRDMAIGDPVSSAPGSHDRRGPPHLVACSGQGKHGALTVLRRSLVPELIVQVPQGTCHTTKCPAGHIIKLLERTSTDSRSLLRLQTKAVIMQMLMQSHGMCATDSGCTPPPPFPPPTYC